MLYACGIWNGDKGAPGDNTMAWHWASDTCSELSLVEVEGGGFLSHGYMQVISRSWQFPQMGRRSSHLLIVLEMDIIANCAAWLMITYFDVLQLADGAPLPRLLMSPSSGHRSKPIEWPWNSMTNYNIWIKKVRKSSIGQESDKVRWSR